MRLNAKILNGMLDAIRCALFFAAVVILISCFPTASSYAAEKPALKKSIAAHTAKHPRRHKLLALLPLVPVHPVIDTTCIDTLNEIQRSMTAEINRWTNVRYKHGGTSPKGIDCSGFTLRVFQKALNYLLPRTSRVQATLGEEVDKDSLEFGDLLFFYSKSRRHKRINHVAIYVGDGNFVHSHIHHGVGMDSLDEEYYAKHFAVAKRVIPVAAEASESD